MLSRRMWYPVLCFMIEDHGFCLTFGFQRIVPIWSVTWLTWRRNTEELWLTSMVLDEWELRRRCVFSRISQFDTRTIVSSLLFVSIYIECLETTRSHYLPLWNKCRGIDHWDEEPRTPEIVEVHVSISCKWKISWTCRKVSFSDEMSHLKFCRVSKCVSSFLSSVKTNWWRIPWR